MSSPDGIDWTFHDIGLGGIGGFVKAAGLHQGGKLDFDAAHGILYSSNCQDGFWRMKLR